MANEDFFFFGCALIDGTIESGLSPKIHQMRLLRVWFITLV